MKKARALGTPQERLTNHKRSSAQELLLVFLVSFLTVAAKASVIIDNATAAIVPIIQLAPSPVAIPVLALGTKVITTDVNVAAAL